MAGVNGLRTVKMGMNLPKLIPLFGLQVDEMEGLGENAVNAGELRSVHIKNGSVLDGY